MLFGRTHEGILVVLIGALAPVTLRCGSVRLCFSVDFAGAVVGSELAFLPEELVDEEELALQLGGANGLYRRFVITPRNDWYPVL